MAITAAAGLAAAVFLCAADAQENVIKQPVLLCSLVGASPTSTRPAKLPGHDYALRLLEAEFDVRVIAGPPGSASLADVKVVWLVPASGGATASATPDFAALLQFVEAGGGLFVLAEPSSANDAAAKLLEPLLRRLGVLVNPARIGPKTFLIPTTCPEIGGLCWAFDQAHPLEVEDGGPLLPPVLVRNDLAQRPKQTGAKDYPGALMVWGDKGQGRVAIVAGSGWASDAVMRKATGASDPPPAHDNAEILRRLLRWAAQAKP
jgi:hypothetical protein